MNTHPQGGAILKAAQVWPSMPLSVFYPLRASQIKENHFQTVMNRLYSRLFAWNLPLRECEHFLLAVNVWGRCFSLPEAWRASTALWCCGGGASLPGCLWWSTWCSPSPLGVFSFVKTLHTSSATSPLIYKTPSALPLICIWLVSLALPSLGWWLALHSLAGDVQGNSSLSAGRWRGFQNCMRMICFLHGSESGSMICPILWSAVSQLWHFGAALCVSLQTGLPEHFHSSHPS